MASLRSADRSEPPGHGVLLGAALGWIALSVLAFTVVFTLAGTGWMPTIVASALAAGGLGWVIGTTGLGWAGWGGAIGGLLLAALLPLGIILPLLLRTGSIDVALPVLAASWIGYLVYLAVAAPVIAAGVWLGLRSRRRVRLRADIVVLLGLVMLAAWAGLSLLVVLSSGAA